MGGRLLQQLQSKNKINFHCFVKAVIFRIFSDFPLILPQTKDMHGSTLVSLLSLKQIKW